MSGFMKRKMKGGKGNRRAMLSVSIMLYGIVSIEKLSSLEGINRWPALALAMWRYATIVTREAITIRNFQCRHTWLPAFCIVPPASASLFAHIYFLIIYLSACSTVQNKAALLSDEVLHVVSRFQVARFRHVVGCLWPSDDKVCIAITKSFYHDLSQGGAVRFSDDKGVPLALHRAAMNVQENCEYRNRPLL
jgi:hypothetical protein